MSSAEAALARMLAGAAARPAAILLRGTVQSWDGTSGYVVAVAGSDLPVTAILASAAGTLAPGDVVAVLRQSSTILVLGEIAAPS